jgi:hypothetical protein
VEQHRHGGRFRASRVRPGTSGPGEQHGSGDGCPPESVRGN